MITIFIMLVLGLLFVFMEFYIPGAILGIIGSILLVVSVVLFATESDSLAMALLYMVFVFALVGMLIHYTLKKIPQSKSRFSIYSNKDQKGYKASSYDASVIGKKGTVIADLKPGGYILVEGKKHQAISLSGYIARGLEVDIVGGQEESLIVQLTKDGKL